MHKACAGHARFSLTPRLPRPFPIALSCVGFVLGDLLAQHLGHEAGLDALRALRLGLYGLALDGPLGSVWYDWLVSWACSRGGEQLGGPL